MYGLFNLAIEEAILERYGQQVWDLIKRKASLSDMDDVLRKHIIYDDDITYRLIEAAERVLKDKPYGFVSQMIGEKFYELVLPGYERVLKLLGGNLMEFLDNLDALHDHLQSRDHLNLRPPSFRCTTQFKTCDEINEKSSMNEAVSINNNSNNNNNNSTTNNKRDDSNNNNNSGNTNSILYLHYYSDRAGLEGIVMGMVKAAARELHRLRIDIELIQIKTSPPPSFIKPADHPHQAIKPLINSDKNGSNGNSSGIATTDDIVTNSSVAVSTIATATTTTISTITGSSTIASTATGTLLLKSSAQVGNTQKTTAIKDHSVFKITLLSLYSQHQASMNVQQLLMPDESFTYKDCPQLNSNLNRISPLVFAQALPFHLVFDRQLTVLQAGTSIIRVLPSLKEPGTKLPSTMKMIKPMNVELTFDNILKYINTMFVFRPDEAQVIASGGHRHLQQLYLETLQDQENRGPVAHSDATATMPINRFGLSDNNGGPVTTTGSGQATLTQVTLNDESIMKQQRQHLCQLIENHQNNSNNNINNAHSNNMLDQRVVNTANDGSQFTLSYQLPEDDLNKFIVKLKGQMIYMKDRDLILFICSPSVKNLNELNDTGLYLSDIPLHDATRDLVLLSEQFDAEYKLTKNLEKLHKQLNLINDELKDEKKKTDSLLYSVLPPSVANELRHHRQVPAKRFTTVTILFSGIVGFGEFCANNSDSDGAIRIVNLLNKIYTTFDVLTEPKTNPHVYKVETVGDKYMAVSGLPEPCESHAKCINRLALDIMDLCKTIKLEEYTGIKAIERDCLEPPTQMNHCEHLRITIGVHCGEVVTGVIGKRTPRYCLFGNTVNLTSRCETTGEKGAINVSQDVYEICMKDKHNFDPEFKFRYRGEIIMKGRTEPMQMWFLTRREPNDDTMSTAATVPYWPMELSEGEISGPSTPPEDTSV